MKLGESSAVSDGFFAFLFARMMGLEQLFSRPIPMSEPMLSPLPWYANAWNGAGEQLLSGESSGDVTSVALSEDEVVRVIEFGSIHVKLMIYYESIDGPCGRAAIIPSYSWLFTTPYITVSQKDPSPTKPWETSLEYFSTISKTQ